MANDTKNLTTNDDHVCILHEKLAGEFVVGVGSDTKGDLIIQFSKYILKLHQGQKFELMEADSIVSIHRPDRVIQ